MDNVNHPAHYTYGKYETADVLDDWFRSEPLLWCAGKYQSRWNKKGDPIENLEKAIWFLNRKIGQIKSETITKQTAIQHQRNQEQSQNEIVVATPTIQQQQETKT